MDMRGAEGLSTLICREGNLAVMAAATIRSSGIAELDVLPSGPRFSNPAELLAQPRLAELLAWAESVYDQVLIDSPPALATSDAAVIGRLVDGVVMVVRPEKNRRRHVLRAAESFSSLHIPLLGVVINQIEAEHRAGYYGYGTGYEYDYDTHDESNERVTCTTAS
jgi:Mrp family chromosome partitioning ATPase